MLTVHQNFDERVIALVIDFREKAHIFGVEQALSDYMQGMKFSNGYDELAVALERIRAEFRI